MQKVNANFLWLLFLAMLYSAVAGCGDSGPAKYPVAGVVTYDDELVPTGWVIFLTPDGERINAEIGADGSYSAELPKGELQVGVSAPRESAKTGIEAFQADVLEPYVPVRFADPQHTGISIKVEATDSNQIDITLKADDKRRR